MDGPSPAYASTDTVLFFPLSPNQRVDDILRVTYIGKSALVHINALITGYKL